MAERDPIELLNDWLEQGAPEPDEIRGLVAVARGLRGMPSEIFRQRLKTKLKEQAMTATTAKPTIQLREGFRSVTPYIIVPGAARFIEFVKQAFGAEEKLSVPAQDGSRIMHAEVKIGDSMIELSDGNEQYSSRPAAIHLYVPDAGGAYERALAAGATSVHPVEEMPYGERSGGVKDPFGNHWYIATAHGSSHVPEGLHTVNSYLHPEGADKLIEFLKQAFGGEEVELHRETAGGPIIHAKIRLGDTIVEMSDARPPYGPMPTGLHFYVPDVDAAYERALKAGASSLSAPADQPYGERGAGVKDPTGNSWFLATPLSGQSAS